MEDFVERLDALRRPGERKKDFARRIGISPVQMSRYYSGSARPGRKVLERISARTGVSLDWLLSGVESREEQAPARRLGAKVSRSLTDQDRVDLACSYLDELRKVDREGRGAIKELIRETVNNPALREKMTTYLSFLKFKMSSDKKG